MVGDKFKAVWKSGSIDAWLRVLDYALASDGCEIGITDDEVESLFCCMSRRTIKDAEDLCVDAFRLVFESHKDLFVAAMNAAVASTATMSQLKVYGKFYGKKTNKPNPQQVRAILPFTAALQILDVVLAERLELLMDESLQPARSLHIGARRRTQTLEIAQSLSLVSEKSADRRSQGAIVQYDVATYYDTILVMMVVRDMQRAGTTYQMMAAVVRHELCVSVRVSAGCAGYVDVPQRTSGALAGSRVAGKLGRWPVEMAMRIAMSDPSVRGWSMPQGHDLLYASYVDNLYGVADSPSQLAHNMQILEHLLMERWRLRIKPGSSQMVVCRGSADVTRDYDGDDECCS